MRSHMTWCHSKSCDGECSGIPFQPSPKPVVADPMLPTVTWLPGMTLEDMRMAVVAAAVAHYPNKRAAAQSLGISRQTLKNWIDNAPDANKEH